MRFAHVTDETRAGEKKQRLLQALDQGLTQIHLDARRPGVLVPERYRTDHHLVLNLSYRFDPPDLTVTEWGVRQTLLFGGQRFTIGAPWSAGYAVASLVSREFWMYPDDMPDELADAAQERVTKADLVPLAERRAREEPAPARAVLREVVLERPEGEEAAPRESSPPRKGHLRVVK
jgi:stringent starvation protein B